MNVLFEVLKYTIPALVVFMTVYYLFKTYLEGQLRMKSLEMQSNRSKDSLPVRLQTYERLALFCERIRLQSLVFRLNQPGMEQNQLGRTMLIAIEQEYEHNMAQQVYVGEKLWEIILLAKNQNQELIHAAMKQSGDFVQNLSALDKERSINPVDHAIAAIRQEMSVYL